MFGFDNMFNGCFKPVAKGMCKLGMNGRGLPLRLPLVLRPMILTTIS